MKKILLLLSIVSILLLVGCTNQEAVSEESVENRDESIGSGEVITEDVSIRAF